MNYRLVVWKRARLSIVLALTLAFSWAGCSSAAQQSPIATATAAVFLSPQLVVSVSPSHLPSGYPTPPSQAPSVRVVRVIDGDTIEIEGGARVRYIGIDTPETYGTAECIGQEAKEKNRELVEGKLVRLEKDVSETDRYGRLLRYVYVDDLFVNAELVRQGFAYASTYPPDVKYAGLFLDLQREAGVAGRGLWSACAMASPSSPQLSPSGPKDNCDSSYPDVCIAPPPPDLDCGDITYRRFRVLPPDPHHLDTDGDGIGCERD